MDLIRFRIIQQSPPVIKWLGYGRRTVGSPLFSIIFAVLFADDSAHLADGLHGADQILRNGHIKIPPELV